ncbi:MAG: putative capsid protein [Cressdnaviricota sp.]|nr:MAG: putative capsid protein [Cressdnaviricota sp.]
MAWKKPKTLKRKFIKRRTGAKAQSKQIMSLSNVVKKLTKTQFEPICTIWNRNDLSVDSLAGGTLAYICPLPKSMCNVYGQTTLQTQGNPDQRLPFSDNLGIAAQPTYLKGSIFGASEAARRSNEIHHMGGVLKWRLTSSEPSFGTYSVFVISPKVKQADQLITDRGLKSGATPGLTASLTEGLDYITHPDVMGTVFNRKMWNVHYTRSVNFGHPGSTALVTNVNPANTNPRNNSIIAEGSVKLKAGGVIKCFNNQALDVAGANDRGFKPLNASQIGYIDEQNEKTQYLVIVNNGVSADLETVNLSLLCKDFYKAVV